MKSSGNLVSTIIACVLAAVVAVVLAVADRERFREAEFSPLYKATLDEAYSRFRENDKRVPAGGGAEDIAAAAPQQAAPAGRIVPAAPQSPARALPKSQVEASPQDAAHAGVAKAASDEYNSPAMTRGNQCATAKDYEQALAAFREHLQSFPGSSIAWHRIGDVLAQQSKQDEAVAAYRQALGLRPSFYCVHGHIGDILRAQGKAAEAEAEFAALVTGYRGEIAQGGAVATGAKFQLGKFLAEHDRDGAEAIKLLEEAAAESPDQASYLFPLVPAYQRAGRAADAIGAIDRVLKLKPEFEPYYKDLRAQLAGPGKP